MASKPGKKPEDHKAPKPKVETVEVPLDAGDPEAGTVTVKRVEIRGVTVDVPEEAFDDFEILDDVRAVQDNRDMSRMPSLLRRLVGEQYNDVMNALRNDKGRVTIEAGSEFLMELFGALNPN